jgi:hypothetical protein
LFPLGETVLRIESYASAGPVELRLNVIDSEIRYPSETITLYRRHWFQIAPVAVLGQWTSPNCSMSVHHPMISIDPVTCIISGLAELSPGEHVLQVHSWASAPPAEVRIRVLEAEITVRPSLRSGVGSRCNGFRNSPDLHSLHTVSLGRMAWGSSWIPRLVRSRA